MWSLSFSSCLLYKNHSLRATACPVQDTTDRKQGGPTWSRRTNFFLTALDFRCSVKTTLWSSVVWRYIRTIKSKLDWPCTPQLLRDHLAPSLWTPVRFYWVKLRKYLLCTVWVLTHFQNKKMVSESNFVLAHFVISLNHFPLFKKKTIERS